VIKAANLPAYVEEWCIHPKVEPCLWYWNAPMHCRVPLRSLMERSAERTIKLERKSTYLSSNQDIRYPAIKVWNGSHVFVTFFQSRWLVPIPSSLRCCIHGRILVPLRVGVFGFTYFFVVDPCFSEFCASCLRIVCSGDIGLVPNSPFWMRVINFNCLLSFRCVNQ